MSERAPKLGSMVDTATTLLRGKVLYEEPSSQSNSDLKSDYPDLEYEASVYEEIKASLNLPQ